MPISKGSNLDFARESTCFVGSLLKFGVVSERHVMLVESPRLLMCHVYQLNSADTHLNPLLVGSI